jgi:hypothetical protein
MSEYTEEVKNRKAAKERNLNSLKETLRGTKDKLELEFSAEQLKDKSLEDKLNTIFDTIKMLTKKMEQRELDNPRIFSK